MKDFLHEDVKGLYILQLSLSRKETVLPPHTETFVGKQRKKNRNYLIIFFFFNLKKLKYNHEGIPFQVRTSRVYGSRTANSMKLKIAVM